ncbi:uncharacterized protein LOC102717453 [Oryza brachyantha]|uniref:uncharacterized protein LOC102717453 n=1 Tax=Oryza brachyantha TaxID=4533 RepID=UPI001ADC69B3|nr:uncharacterized protein LOC102717453 [Oryza brachyantha]
MASGLLGWLCVGPEQRRLRRRRRGARLVLWGGERRAAEAGRMAGEVMVEHAGRLVVCRADGFRLGRPAPVLAIEDRLEAGATYLVLPVDRLPQGRDVVTAASLAALTYDRACGGGGGGVPLLAGGAKSPFEYVKDDGGRTVIKVTEEFIVKAVTGRKPPGRNAAGGSGRGDKAADGDDAHGPALCSTPELRKHYEQLVGATRGRPWSPRLETIKERKGRRVVDVVVSPGRLSPVRLLGLVDKGIR